MVTRKTKFSIEIEKLKINPGLRVLADDLLHLAGLK